MYLYEWTEKKIRESDRLYLHNFKIPYEFGHSCGTERVRGDVMRGNVMFVVDVRWK